MPAARPYTVSLALRDELVDAVERHGRDHRPEDFFLHHLHVFSGIHEHRGLHEVAVVAGALCPPAIALAPS